MKEKILMILTRVISICIFAYIAFIFNCNCTIFEIILCVLVSGILGYMLAPFLLIAVVGMVCFVTNL